MRRLPAEWEPQRSVLIAWPHPDTDWNYMLGQAEECYRNLAAAILPHARLIVVGPDPELPRRHLSALPQDRITYVQMPTNDTWTRDYGAITLVDDNGRKTVCDFKFNGWGLKFASDRDNLVTRAMYTDGLLEGSYENRLGFVLEGGSIESDGEGTLLTTSQCLLSPNRNGDLNRGQITDRLCQWLGCDHVLWLDHGALQGDDTDSHIDTLARLAPNNTIVYVSTTPDDPQYDELEAMAAQLAKFRTRDGEPYNLVQLPLPEAIYDEDDAEFRLPATYANYLVINDAVLLPTYGQTMPDHLATMIMQSVYPDKQIVTVDCRALIRQHGSLHCATMQLL